MCLKQVDVKNTIVYFQSGSELPLTFKIRTAIEIYTSPQIYTFFILFCILKTSILSQWFCDLINYFSSLIPVSGALIFSVWKMSIKLAGIEASSWHIYHSLNHCVSTLLFLYKGAVRAVNLFICLFVYWLLAWFWTHNVVSFPMLLYCPWTHILHKGFWIYMLV